MTIIGLSLWIPKAGQDFPFKRLLPRLEFFETSCGREAAPAAKLWKGNPEKNNVFWPTDVEEQRKIDTN